MWNNQTRIDFFRVKLVEDSKFMLTFAVLNKKICGNYSF